MALVTSLEEKKVLYKLRTKLLITYVVIALSIVGLITVLFFNLVDKHFISYVQENNEKNLVDLVHSIEHQYHTSEAWDYQKLEAISSRALEDGIVLTVKDKNDSTIWDTSNRLSKTEEELLNPIRSNMEKRYRAWNGAITSKNVSLHLGEQTIGTAIMKYYNPFYFTGHDMDFINMLYKMLNIVMLVSIIFAVTLGLWISRQISIPISRAIVLTREISAGSLKGRVEVKSSTTEIKDLSESVNLLAEKLEEQEAMRKRIVSDVSHELRTPLTSIQNHMEALIDGLWQPTQERLSNIYKEILRVNRLVGDLSKLAKYENRVEKLNLTIFNLDEVIMRIVTGFESEIHKKNINLNIQGKVKSIFADEDKISQVIVNILSNSIKYSKDDSKIDVSTYEENSYAFIKIKDTGVGIPKEDLPFVFERFYRVDKSRNRASGGSGVGLTIAKAIIEAHKGEISIESEYGAGTEITIMLPIKH